MTGYGQQPCRSQLAGFPVSRPSSSMGYGQNLDGSADLAVHDRKRKTPQEETPATSKVPGPCSRRFDDSFDGTIQLGEERISGSGTSLSIPLRRRCRFLDGLRVELNPSRRHHRPAIRRRASAQGTSLTLPASTSLRRARISASHAASASSSRESSRLSSKDPARAARASGGNFNASLRISATFCSICLSYSSHRPNGISLIHSSFQRIPLLNSKPSGRTRFRPDPHPTPPRKWSRAGEGGGRFDGGRRKAG